MAKTFKKKASGHSHRKNAGRKSFSSRRVSHTAMRRKKNPAGLGRPMDWLKGGVGVLAGVVVTRALPQAFLSQYNTGGVGYLLNAGTAIAAAWATHAFTKDPVLTASVAAGGFAALIARVISDMTSFGQYLSLTGVGDYMVSNFVSPQRIVDQSQAMLQVPSGWGATPAVASSSMGSDGMSGLRGGDY